jgi:hypothetical protein
MPIEVLRSLTDNTFPDKASAERRSCMKTAKEIPSAQVRKDMQSEEFDVVILGGSTGSTIAAWTFAGEGKRGAVVDRRYIGGSCPNIACLPSKNIITVKCRVV